MKEIGTLKIVEIIDDVPNMEVTIDTNEYASNKTLASLANMAYGCRVFAVPTSTAVGQDKILIEDGRILNNGVFIPISRVIANVTHPAASDSCVVSLKVDPNASPQYTITFHAPASENPTTPPNVPAGEIGIAEIRNVPTTGIVTQNMITDTRTWGTVNLNDFEEAKADIYVPMKPSVAGSDSVDRTAYVENIFVNRVDLNYTVDGVATENYAGETDNKRYFVNNAKFVIKEQKRASATGTTWVLAYTPTQLLNSKYMLLLVKNGVELVEGTDFTVDSGTKTVTFTTSLAVGDQLKARYTSSTGGLFHSDVDEMITFFYESDTKRFEKPGGIKKGMVEIYLTESGVDNELTRVQSARISATLTREVLSEVNKLSPYSRPANLPYEATVSLEFTDSDLEVLARMSGLAYSGGVISGANEINVNSMLKNRGLKIKIYRVNDEVRATLPANHPWLSPLKTISIPYLIPTDETWNSRVNANATQTYNYRTHTISVVA
jgi:hypothetical protein